MRARILTIHGLLGTLLVCGIAAAQTPVDEDGNAYVATASGASIEPIGDDYAPRLSSRDLETLVGPVALYPDTLLAVILPAAAYPLQIVQAARFLDELDADPTLTPPADWDESVVALLNYPEILRELSDDIDWTLELGEAVISQQADVLSAIQRFRDRAYVAGNLKSDARQHVHRDDSIIEIEPVDDSIIYVPVYEPSRVVVHSVRPVYTYRPNPYPVYYYPYSDAHAFRSGFFWGLTSAYALGWDSYRVHVIHHSFPGHPFYGHYYSPRWWYRRPTLVYHNRHYHRDNMLPSRVRNRVGDYWTPRQSRYTILRDSRLPRRGQDGYRVRRHADTAATLTRRDTGVADNVNRYASHRQRNSAGSIQPPANTRQSPFRGTRRSAERAALPGAAAPPASADRRVRASADASLPRAVSRPGERARTYRRNEPSRQAAPKRYSMPEPAPAPQLAPQSAPQSAPPRYSRPEPVSRSTAHRQMRHDAGRQVMAQHSSRTTPVQQSARQSSVQRQSRSSSSNEPSRNRDKGRHRLRDD